MQSPLSKELVQQILDAATDVVMVTEATPLDAPGPAIVFVNEAFTELTGYTAEEAIGQSPRILQGPGTDRATLDHIRSALERHESCHVTVLNYAKTGREYWLDLKIYPLHGSDGTVTHFAAIERDKTNEMEAAKELYEAATVDELTGAINRRHFDDELDEAVHRSGRYDRPLTLVMFDLDRFKKTNDTHGHAAGDEVLKMVAQVCRPMVRNPDMLGRVGGEEFAVLLNETPLDGGLILADRLRQAIADSSVEHEGHTLRITASFGCAQLAAGEDGEALMGRADDALYRAKDNGRNRVEAAD